MTDGFPDSSWAFACDWGTSSFRLILASRATGIVLGRTATNAGAATFSGVADRPTAFSSYLEAQVRELLAAALGGSIRSHPRPSIPIWVSGMASSSIGWRELPYISVPLDLETPELNVEALDVLSPDLPFPVFLVSGVRTDGDIIRGEETQVLGLLSTSARRGLREDALLILPGTHSKHLRIEDGCLVGFTTYITGELFALLAETSVLRHSVDATALRGEEASRLLDGAFADGVRAACERPLSAALFQVRTGQILRHRKRDEGAAFLSGILIGSELAGSSAVEHAGTILLAAPKRRRRSTRRRSRSSATRRSSRWRRTRNKSSPL